MNDLHHLALGVAMLALVSVVSMAIISPQISKPNIVLSALVVVGLYPAYWLIYLQVKDPAANLSLMLGAFSISLSFATMLALLTVRCVYSRGLRIVGAGLVIASLPLSYYTHFAAGSNPVTLALIASAMLIAVSMENFKTRSKIS